MIMQGKFLYIFSRPGRSQGLLYKQPHEIFSPGVRQPFPPTALRRRHAQKIRYSSSIYKIDYVIVIKNFLNPKGHQNPINGSKVTAILLQGRILHICGASEVKGLRSTGLPHLVFDASQILGGHILAGHILVANILVGHILVGQILVV